MRSSGTSYPKLNSKESSNPMEATTDSGMPKQETIPEKFDLDAAKAARDSKAAKDFLKLRDSKLGKELAQTVKRWHLEAKNNRTPEERQWAINIAAYKGKTGLGIVPSLPEIPSNLHGRIARLPGQKDNGPRINRIRPVIRTEMARLISQKPSAYVLPSSSDDQDLFAAQAGEQAWQSIQERAKLQAKFSRAAFWITVTGTGFLKAWWDESLFDKDSWLNGDVAFDVPSPFHIFVPDKMEKDIEGQPWVIHAFAKPLGWAQQQYKDQLAGVKLAASTSRTTDIVDNTILGVADTGMSEKDSVLVYEAWIKPGTHPELPNGGLVTVVNDTLVGFSDTFPYEHGEFPFTKYESMPTETFYADSVIVDILPIVNEYNVNRKRIQDSIDKMSSLQLMAPRGSVIPQKITNEIGQVIQYNPGLGKPEPFPLQQIPGYVPQALDRSLLDIEDISGQHQVSKGSVPTGVTAATAISFLQERDETYFVHTIASVEQGMEKLGRQALSLAVQYWDDARIVKSVGEDNVYDITALRGADLRRGTDLKVEAGSALPESKAARQALIMDLMSQGFVPPEEGLKLLEIGGSKKMMDHLRVDERQAQRENQRLRQLSAEDIQQYKMMWEMEMSQMQQQGVVSSGAASPTGEGAFDDIGTPEAPPIIPVNSWDNHEVHIEIHNRFRKSQVFDMLPTEVKEQFEEHVEAHQQAMIVKSMNDFMAMIPSDGSLEGDPNIQQPGNIGLPESGLPGAPPEGLGDTPIDPAAGATTQGVQEGLF